MMLTEQGLRTEADCPLSLEIFSQENCKYLAGSLLKCLKNSERLGQNTLNKALGLSHIQELQTPPQTRLVRRTQTHLLQNCAYVVRDVSFCGFNCADSLTREILF